MTVTTEIGKPRARKEDARLVTGQTNWTDNIVLPGMLHVCYVRSPMAHARIRSVDVSAARGAPGVIAAFSGADFAAEQGSLPCAWPVTRGKPSPSRAGSRCSSSRWPWWAPLSRCRSWPGRAVGARPCSRTGGHGRPATIPEPQPATTRAIDARADVGGSWIRDTVCLVCTY